MTYDVVSVVPFISFGRLIVSRWWKISASWSTNFFFSRQQLLILIFSPLVNLRSTLPSVVPKDGPFIFTVVGPCSSYVIYKLSRKFSICGIATLNKLPDLFQEVRIIPYFIYVSSVSI